MKKFLNRIKSMSAGVLAMSMLLALQPTGLAAAASPITLAANKDAWVDQAHTSDNHGGDSNLKVKSKDNSDNRRVYISFDISSIPSGMVINSASLRLRVNNTPNSLRTYDIFRASSSWAENSITWQNKPAYAGAATASTAIDETDNHSFVSWDVTSDVAAFYAGSPNNGWVIKDRNESNSPDAKEIIFASREDSQSGLRPQLVIEYSPIADTTPPVVIITSPADGATTGGTGNITYSVGDANSVACTLDGNPVACTLSGPYAFDLTTGSHTFVVTGTDTSSNSASDSVTWNVDATGPVVIITSTPSTTATSGNISFTVTDASVPVSPVCSLDGGAFIACSSPFDYGPLAQGSHTFSVKATDVYGNMSNTASISWTITSQSSNTAPVITLLGANPMNLTVGDTFTDPGATATDLEDGNITSSIVVSGSVNTAVAGSYTLTYNVTDSGSLAATPVTRTVNVGAAEPVNTAPVITLLGTNPMNLTVGDTFADPGATAADAQDGDLTSSIVVGGSVNTAVVGTYTLTYDVTDSGGFPAAQVTRTVNVNPAGTQECDEGFHWNGEQCVQNETSPTPTPTPTPPAGGGGGTRTGTLVIQKVVVGSSVSYSTFGFNFGDGHDQFNTNGVNTYTRPQGTYTVVEDPAEGFTTTYGGDCNAEGIITVSGNTATCVITNTAVAPSESPTPTPGGEGGYNEPTPTPTPSETPTPSPTPTPTPVRVISRVNAGSSGATPTPSASVEPVASASNDQVAAAGVILGLDLCSTTGHIIWWITLFAIALALLWFGRRRGAMFWLIIAYVVIWTLWAWTLCGFGWWWLPVVLGIIVWLLSAPKNEK